MYLSRSGQSVLPKGSKRKPSNAFAIAYGLGLTIFLFVAVDQATDTIGDYPVEFVLSMAVGGFSIYGQLLSLQRDASIQFVSFVFCFLFMSIAPIVQMGADADPVFRIGHWALWVLVGALAFTIIGVLSTYRMTKPDKETISKPETAPSNVNYLLVLLVTVVSSSITIVLFYDSLFTSRETFSIATSEFFTDPAISMIARMFLFNTPFFGAMIGLRASISNRKKQWMMLFFIGALMAAIVNNPLVNPRYQLAGLGFFVIDYMFYGRRTKLLAVMIIVGVLLAPVFQVFRYDELNDQTSEQSGNKLFGQTFLSMDYDAFSVSCYTMLTVDNDGISWGSNLAGAALFFVPRALWPGKPPQTSWIIFDTIEHTRVAGTNNLSTPLTAEGYYAFGWLGVLFISLLYWWTISRVVTSSRKDPSSWAFLARCVLAGLTLIFLRGTLIVGFGAVVGSLAAASIPAFLLKHRF